MALNYHFFMALCECERTNVCCCSCYCTSSHFVFSQSFAVKLMITSGIHFTYHMLAHKFTQQTASTSRTQRTHSLVSMHYYDLFVCVSEWVSVCVAFYLTSKRIFGHSPNFFFIVHLSAGQPFLPTSSAATNHKFTKARWANFFLLISWFFLTSCVSVFGVVSTLYVDWNRWNTHRIFCSFPFHI